PNVIVKTLILHDSNGRYVAVVLAGDQRLDFDKVQRHIGVAKLRFASHADVLRVTGYPAGGTPPFGHAQPIPTLVDAAVMREPFVLGGGGRVELLVKIEPATLVAVARATIGDFAKQSDDNGRTTMSDDGRPFAIVS
ncbi:MAG: YbaK/EbsC family protein, partial [Chloroflexota bacterium]